jgi:phosphonate transport system permease protein
MRWAAGLAVLAGAFWISEVSPEKLWLGLPAMGRYVMGTLPERGELGGWMWGWRRWLGLLWDTILIAYLGTLLGAVAGFLISFVAERNLTPAGWLGGAARRVLELARTVPELVFALIFVIAFGLGPLAGVLALALHAMGAIGKMCSDLLEHVNAGPMEGMRASGANWWETMRYGAAPQILPGFLSYALFRFEVNVRASSVIGFIGVGGIGQELYVSIRQFVYQDISAIVLLIVVAVAAIDQMSEWARRRIAA